MVKCEDIDLYRLQERHSYIIFATENHPFWPELEQRDKITFT